MRKRLSIALLTTFLSFLAGPAAVYAQCPPVTIEVDNPWFEDFESYPHNAAVPLSDCWATPESLVVDNGTSPFVYTGYPYASHSGSNSLELKRSPVMVVFPEFTNPVNLLSISFWGNTSAQNAAAAGTLTLGVVTDASDPSSFIPVETIPATAFGRVGQDAPYTNFMGEHSLQNIDPQPGMRIALRLTGTQRSWNLDDITITAAGVYRADSLPYADHFDSVGSWRLNNGDAPNRWTIAQPDGTGNPALFVTHDNTSPGYNIAVASTVMAEKKLVMPEDDTVTVAFDVMAGGESHFDFLKVFLVPESTEFAAGTHNNAQSQSLYADHALDFTPFKALSAGSDGYPHLFNLCADTVRVTAGMTNPAPGEVAKLVFLWRNDNTTGTQPGAMISNLRVTAGAPCRIPTGLQVTNVANESIDIAWEPAPETSSWNVRYRTPDSAWTAVAAASNSCSLPGLAGSTMYEIQVQADCGDGDLSLWSDTLTVTTTNVGINSWLENSVMVFPNPTNDFVNVQCTMYNVQMSADLHLFDVYGKLVQTVPMTGETTSVNVSALADGLYFVRVTTDEGVVTKPFVVKR